MKFLRLWLPVFFWCWLIFYFSSIPNLKTQWGAWDLILRKAAHISEYLILTWLLYRGVRGSFRLTNFYLYFWPSLLALLYAVSDELHQAFVPGRGPSLRDILIDSIGIAFFVILKFQEISQAKEKLSSKSYCP
ncbi:MAG: VanZ family protein [Candidatus Omnitrophica bacterium]|nr:VanZ family protein [Candidatus Omnitrophota bacterium]